MKKRFLGIGIVLILILSMTLVTTVNAECYECQNNIPKLSKEEMKTLLGVMNNRDKGGTWFGFGWGFIWGLLLPAGLCIPICAWQILLLGVSVSALIGSVMAAIASGGAAVIAVLVEFGLTTAAATQTWECIEGCLAAEAID